MDPPPRWRSPSNRLIALWVTTILTNPADSLQRVYRDQAVRLMHQPYRAIPSPRLAFARERVVMWKRCRDACRAAVVVLLGARFPRDVRRMVARDVRRMVAAMVWETRWDDRWLIRK